MVKFVFLSLLSLLPLESYGQILLDKLYINSDNLTIDQTKQRFFFTGRVILWFDDMVLKTNNLEVIYQIVEGKKNIDYIIIPTKLTAKREKNQELLIADSAKYFMNKNKLTLLGNVILQQKDHILKTDNLVYYTKLKSIQQE